MYGWPREIELRAEISAETLLPRNQDQLVMFIPYLQKWKCFYKMNKNREPILKEKKYDKQKEKYVIPVYQKK